MYLHPTQMWQHEPLCAAVQEALVAHSEQIGTDTITHLHGVLPSKQAALQLMLTL